MSPTDVAASPGAEDLELGHGSGGQDDGDDVRSPAQASSLLGYVEGSTLRTSEDFSRDTPQPKLIRRAYLHRKAKERFGPRTPSSPTSSPDKTDTEKSPRGGGLFSGGSLASLLSPRSDRRRGSPGNSPSNSPSNSPGNSPTKRERSPSMPAAQSLSAALGISASARRLSDTLLAGPLLGSPGAGQRQRHTPAVASDQEPDVADEEAEDPVLSQLRSSVRSLCF